MTAIDTNEPTTALSLRERARAACEATEREAADCARERAEAEQKGEESRLRGAMKTYLQISKLDHLQTITDDDGAFLRYEAVVDGLRFCLVDKFGHARLAVLVNCSHNCGKALFVPLYSLTDLHQALTIDQSHAFACLQQYGDDGEPITDRLGNPLPTKEPTEPARTALDYAKQQIARIADATSELVKAMDAEHAAIGARDDAMNAAVKTLIGTPNELTGKPHSQESAEKAVKQTDEYKRLAATRIEAESNRLCASAACEAQKLHARLAVAVIEHAIPTGDLH